MVKVSAGVRTVVGARAGGSPLGQAVPKSLPVVTDHAAGTCDDKVATPAGTPPQSSFPAKLPHGSEECQWALTEKQTLGAAAHLSEVTALPSSASQSLVMPSVV